MPCFKFEILETAKTSVTFRVTPTVEDVPYVLMMVDKAIFDAFESVEAYIADDLMWFDEVAMGMGITLEDYLATMLNRGVKEDSADGLAPDTAYYLYAYHPPPLARWCRTLSAWSSAPHSSTGRRSPSRWRLVRHTTTISRVVSPLCESRRGP